MTLRSIWNELLIELMDRIDMPQVSHDDMPEAFSTLKDMGIGVSMKSVLPGKLKHSQKKVNAKKVQNIAKDLQSGKKMPPIVIANDNSIVDGHHRQVAYEKINPRKPINVVMIDLPGSKAIEAYKKVEEMV